MATGKNVRYAVRMATDFQPAMPFDPSPTTTIGAIARIGTVCEATMYGRIPRSSRRDCERATASPKPTTPPRKKPARASLPVNQAALSSDRMSGGPPVVVGCQNAATTSCRCGIVVSSTTNGQVHCVVSQTHL